jgi:hypothetical protein
MTGIYICRIWEKDGLLFYYAYFRFLLSTKSFVRFEVFTPVKIPNAVYSEDEDWKSVGNAGSRLQGYALSWVRRPQSTSFVFSIITVSPPSHLRRLMTWQAEEGDMESLHPSKWGGGTMLRTRILARWICLLSYAFSHKLQTWMFSWWSWHYFSTLMLHEGVGCNHCNTGGLHKNLPNVRGESSGKSYNSLYKLRNINVPCFHQ